MSATLTVLSCRSMRCILYDSHQQCETCEESAQLFCSFVNELNCKNAENPNIYQCNKALTKFYLLNSVFLHRFSIEWSRIFYQRRIFLPHCFEIFLLILGDRIRKRYCYSRRKRVFYKAWLRLTVD